MPQRVDTGPRGEVGRNASTPPRHNRSPSAETITKEVDATETMIERTEDRFDLKPERIAGDVA